MGIKRIVTEITKCDICEKQNVALVYRINITNAFVGYGGFKDYKCKGFAPRAFLVCGECKSSFEKWKRRKGANQ